MITAGRQGDVATSQECRRQPALPEPGGVGQVTPTPSGVPALAATLTPDSWSAELREDTFLWCKLPICGHLL